MKILHVVNSLEPGGMENGVVNLTNALGARGWEIYIACLERCGAFSDRLTNPERIMLLGKAGGFTPHAAFVLARRIRQLQPDVLHSHNLGALIYSALATLGGVRCPLLQGEHSLLTDDECRPPRLRQRRWLYRACHAIHTVSQTMRTELIGAGFPAEKITAIVNGVDTTRFAPGDRHYARSALGLPAGALIVGIVGRFGPYKRHALLLDAFAQIATEFPTAHLLVVGAGGSEEDAVHARAAAHPRVHFTGFRADPNSCYQTLDLLAVPSVNEGLSNAALEAMACGVPVLAQAGCGHEEIITPGLDGWIARMETPEALATQLASALSEPRRLVDFGQAAREKVRQQFSLEAMISAYESLYRSCARRPR